MTEHFEELNSATPISDNVVKMLKDLAQNVSCAELDTDFSEDKIKTIKTLKSNKTSGNDGVINEYLRVTMNIMCPIYVKLFNLIH